MPHLNQLRVEMGAPIANNFRANTSIALLDADAMRQLGCEGVDVEFLEIKPQKDKTLGYKGQRILVYIRDASNYNNNANYKLPVFHISFCQKLEEMQQKGRWQRYVVSNKEDGYFSVRVNNGNAQFEKLNVCRFCLENLQWNQFSIFNMTSEEKSKMIHEFSIQDFFKRFPKSLFSVLPTYQSDIAPVNDYSHQWPEISENLKKEKGFRCGNEDCQIQLTGENRKYLHVHHVNGLKNDNSKSNLKVLCIRCHANEPHHAHLKSGVYYKEFMIEHGS